MKGRGEARRGPSLALGDTRAPRLSYRHLAKDGDHTESAAGNAGVALRFTSESRIRKLELPFHLAIFLFFFFPQSGNAHQRPRGKLQNRQNGWGRGTASGSARMSESQYRSLLQRHSFMAFDTRLTSTDQERLRPRVRAGRGARRAPRQAPGRQCRGALARGRCPLSLPETAQ